MWVCLVLSWVLLVGVLSWVLLVGEQALPGSREAGEALEMINRLPDGELKSDLLTQYPTVLQRVRGDNNGGRIGQHFSFASSSSVCPWLLPSVKDIAYYSIVSTHIQNLHVRQQLLEFERNPTAETQDRDPFGDGDQSPLEGEETEEASASCDSRPFTTTITCASKPSSVK